MSYRRPPAPHETFWHSSGMSGQHAPSSYQRLPPPPPDDFIESTNFNMEDFIFPGENLASQGYGYDSHYQPAAEPPGYRRHRPNPTFNQGPSWTQPAGPPVYSNPPTHREMQNRRLGTSQHQTEPSFNQPAEHERHGEHSYGNPQRGGAPIRLNSMPPQTHHDPQPQNNIRQDNLPVPPPPGVEEFSCTDVESDITKQTEPSPVSNPDPPPQPRQETPKDIINNTDANDDGIILHPVTKVPVKRKLNGTYELVEEANKKVKKTNAPPPPARPKKLPQEVGDGCYCELCDLVCSGPLNLRMHKSGAKHRLNESKAEKGEKAVVRKTVKKKHRGRLVKEGPIPASHIQDETPLIGLDYVTRVVFTDKDESEDVFECSLCDKKDLKLLCIYQHILGRPHRKEYIRKLKPDLAAQYSNIANVYDKNGQLQRRQNSDLSALLNNIIKIAAKRDGPGEMQIRLSSEREIDEDEAEDYGVEGYESEPDDMGYLPPSSEPENRGSHQRLGPNHPHPPAKPPAKPPAYPAIPRPPYSRQDPSEHLPQRDTPALPHSQATGRGDSEPPITRLHPCSPTPDRPPSLTRLPSRALSPEKAPPPAPPSTTNHPLPPVTWLQPHSVPPLPKGNTQAEDRPPPVTRIPSKETPSSTKQTISPADLPPLTDEQLRFYCSDVFIAEEYRRRFGDPKQLACSSQPEGTQGSNAQTKETSSSSSPADSAGLTVEVLLKSLSNTMVNNEEDASMAMQITRALSQATLKYRLREKDLALQKDGKR